MPKVSEFQLQHQSFQRIFTTDFRSSCHPNNCHSEGLLGWWQQRSSGGSSSGLEEHLTAAGELRGAQPASPDWDLILWKEQWRCKWWWWPWGKRRMKRKQRGKKGEGLKRIVPTLSYKWETFYSTIASSISKSPWHFFFRNRKPIWKFIWNLKGRPNNQNNPKKEQKWRIHTSFENLLQS